MQMPLIHLNGSGGPALAKAYADAALAVSLAADAVRKTAPHNRDYYPLDPDGYQYREARLEHNIRLTRMGEVQRELEALALHCQGRMVDAEAARENDR